VTIKAIVANKNTKIWLNYLLGFSLSVLLLYGIYLQVSKELDKIDTQTFFDESTILYLILGICLMPVNIGLEIKKWHLLANTAQPVSLATAVRSYFAGIAFSIITPNRIGEYPARVVYISRKRTFRLISVSILGIISQMLAVALGGFMGGIYYNLTRPSSLSYVLLGVNTIITMCLFLLFWRYEVWMKLAQKVKWLRKYSAYGRLIKRFTVKQQLTILGISLARYFIYTAQYLIFLRWMHIHLPLTEGMFLCALFFWVIAIIPAIAFTELGTRGQVGLLLFGAFTANSIGILSATFVLWIVNIIIPAIIGSILIFKTRVVR
jgi:hypothetical protein